MTSVGPNSVALSAAQQAQLAKAQASVATQPNAGVVSPGDFSSMLANFDAASGDAGDASSGGSGVVGPESSVPGNLKIGAIAPLITKAAHPAAATPGNAPVASAVSGAKAIGTVPNSIDAVVGQLVPLLQQLVEIISAKVGGGDAAGADSSGGLGGMLGGLLGGGGGAAGGDSGLGGMLGGLLGGGGGGDASDSSDSGGSDAGGLGGLGDLSGLLGGLGG